MRDALHAEPGQPARGEPFGADPPGNGAILPSPVQASRTLLSDPRDQARTLIAKRFLAVATVVFVLAALLLATGTFPLRERPYLVAGFAAAALLSFLARRWPGEAPQWAVIGVNVCALAMIAYYLTSSGLGLNSPVVGFMTILPMVICAAVGARAGSVTAVASVASLLALSWAEYRGAIVGAPLLAELPLPRRLINQLLLVGAGLACGLVIAQVLRLQRRASEEREARFAGLLGIAVDTYWELDASLRTANVWIRSEGQRFVPLDRPLASPPWETSQCHVDPPVLRTLLADLAAQRPFHNLQVRLDLNGGRIRHEQVSGQPRFDHDGRFAGYWGVTRDVTAEVQMQQTMHATQARYRELFEASPLALLVHQDLRVVDANPTALRMLGYPDLASLVGRNVLQNLEGDELVKARQRALAALAGERVAPAIFHWTTRDGRHRIVRATATRIEGLGQPSVLSIFDDVTELHDAQEALQRSEATLSHVVATSPDLITLSDLETGRFVMVNDTFTRYSGYAAEEIVGRNAVELGVWRQPDERAAFLAAVREHGTVTNWPHEFFGRGGERYSLLLSAALFDLEGRRYLVLNGRDISETKNTRLAHEAVLDNASLGIAVTREQRFVQANPALEQMLGWPRGTLTGQPGRVVWASDAEYAQIGATLGPRLARGDSVELVREMVRRDGSSFWCRMLVKAVDPSHPMRGGTIWIVEDITERRRTEQALAKARDDAEAASRAKSAFLANTSHEIRTPLNGLVGLARLARSPEVDETRRRQYLEQIADSAETLTAVISDVLDLSKIEAGKLLIEHLPFDLGALFDSVARVYGALADARALTYRQTIAPELQRQAMGDPVRLRQILTNYLNNALKFTQSGGIVLEATAPRANWLRVEVIDTGPGIDPAMQPQLFTPFTQADQSTTRRFGGTGLGLSICRQLAQLMHGQVGVDSAPDRGSRFWVELPLGRVASRSPQAPAGEDDRAASLVGARVLMAEDNAVNMMIAVAMLEQWGAVVSQAIDGAQALEAVAQAEREGKPFDAVLMDVQMPAMSGYEVTRLLRQRHDAQALPIIALTAAALTSERELALAAGMNAFLTKPIDARRLRDTLTATLDARRTARLATP
ncbi:MAG: Sensor histidine kinase RcsC [Burkholderiaceae bacterium]|nr:Sensor histidine kinase RcsC [Burkholderiaceae bacterium]